MKDKKMAHLWVLLSKQGRSDERKPAQGSYETPHGALFCDHEVESRSLGELPDRARWAFQISSSQRESLSDCILEVMGETCLVSCCKGSFL